MMALERHRSQQMSNEFIEAPTRKRQLSIAMKEEKEAAIIFKKKCSMHSLNNYILWLILFPLNLLYIFY